MRVLIFFAGASLLLSACGKGDTAGSNQSAASDLGPDKIVANDVTAIDAVTGDAANMAADVEYNVDANADGENGLDNAIEELGNSTASKPAKSTAPKPKPKPAAQIPPSSAENNSN